MSLRLYNTRTRTVEPFAPIDAGHVRIYVCGLTPSAEAHLGHARSFMFFDVLRRYLTHLGFRVTYVQNVTDIDDRSIATAAANGTSWTDVVEGYYASFKRSMTRLGVVEPDHEPRATKYIAEIVQMTGELIERGNAYAVEDGVYFDVRSFPRYGALSGRNVDDLLIGARIAPDEKKRDPLDFALWKTAKPGRTLVAVAVGRRAARVAYRVFRDVARVARRTVRHSRRRLRLDLPAPRERDRANGIARAAADGERLDARWPAAIRRPEDVEVARQFRTARDAARPARSASDSAALPTSRLS